MGLAKLALAGLFTFTSILSPVYGAEDAQGPRNIRLKTREAGLYLAPPESKEHPEAKNFSTTVKPVAPLNMEEIQKYILEHPELKDYRLVIIGPAVSGDQAEEYKRNTEAVLSAAQIPSEVQIIRHPQGLRENLLNLWPRREDYEKPIPSELKVAIWKILAAEALSFTVLLAPPILQATGTSMGPEVDEIVKKIGLPMGVAVGMCVLDVANMIPLISFRRALSNHNIRLNPTERFMRQLALSLFFSFNFYAVANSPAAYEFVTQANLQEWMHHLPTASLDMLKVIFPASIFNMLSRTTVGTSLNIWEQRGQDRRFYTSLMEAITGILIAPVYILSTMKVLDPVVHTSVMDLNAAHLAMLGFGGAGALAWAKLEWESLAKWLTGIKNSCKKLLGWKGSEEISAKEE